MHPATDPKAIRVARNDMNLFIGGSTALDSLRFLSRPSQSPGAGEGVAGSVPETASLPAPDHLSTMQKIAGTKKTPIKLAASIPPITVVPMIWRATEPAPDAVHNGTQPRMKAKDVIKIGLSRSLAPSSAASARGFPLSN